LTISNSNKKVLLIGADLRNPQLHDYFGFDKNTAGLSNFLSNKSEDWKGLLKENANLSGNLDVLCSGAIPPNPSQLLTNTNFELLIEEAKTLYDFIIIDSAPVQLVSDTLNFSSFADVTVFLVRANFSDIKGLVRIKNLMDKGQLKNVGFVINRVDSNQNTYGYSYGYGLEKEKQPWYKTNK
jgi:capsular exopolysaccharide synthesis family protein